MWRQELTSNITIDNRAMEGTAVPLDYAKMIHRAIAYNDRQQGEGGHGSALGLRQNDSSGDRI
ncbi:hypothetical protein QUA04_01630 [Microcoleus sp. S13_C5]